MSKSDAPVVVHLTSAHQADDVRIFRKECRSIGSAGYRVILIASDSPVERVEGVEFVSLPRPAGRLARMTVGAWRAWKAARSIRADLYHFHDPELLPGALLMSTLGYRVVYDAHEDVAADLLDRDYLPGPLGRVVAAAVGGFEHAVARRVTAVVAATPAIARRHRGARRVVVIANYPRWAEFEGGERTAYAARPNHLAYVGLISQARGCLVMLDALALLRDDGVRLRLAGPFDCPSLRIEAQAHPAWDLVDYLGTVSHAAVRGLLSEVRVGLVPFLPGPNHMDAQPNKLFEYMAAGIPVVASDFPSWKEIVEGAGAGRVVDVLDPRAVAAAIKGVLSDTETSEIMGLRGANAVERTFNWENQAETLLRCYSDILSN